MQMVSRPLPPFYGHRRSGRDATVSSSPIEWSSTPVAPSDASLLLARKSRCAARLSPWWLSSWMGCCDGGRSCYNSNPAAETTPTTGPHSQHLSGLILYPVRVGALCASRLFAPATRRSEEHTSEL